MSARPDRIAAALVRLGDGFEVSLEERTGVFQLAAPERALTFLSSAEFEAANRPVWEITVPFDDETAESDEIDWNGMTLTVLRAVDVRIGGETVVRTLIAAVT